MRAHVGGLTPRDDPRTLQLEDYVADDALTRTRPAASPEAVPRWGLLGNNTVGDCTIAAAGHAVQLWAAPHAPNPDVTDRKVERDYANVRAAIDARGEGISALDALNYWRNTGVCGNRIAAYAAMPTKHVQWMKFAIDRFGCAYAVLCLPDEAVPQDGFDPSWEALTGVKKDKNAHAVIYIAYDADMTLTAVTWGKTKATPWASHRDYCDEMYVALRPDGAAPADVDVTRWEADLAQIDGGGA